MKAQNIKFNPETIKAVKTKFSNLRNLLFADSVCYAFNEDPESPNRASRGDYVSADNIRNGYLNDSYDGFITRDKKIHKILPGQVFTIGREGQIVLKKSQREIDEESFIEACNEPLKNVTEIDEAEILYGTKGNYVIHDDVKYQIITETKKYTYFVDGAYDHNGKLIHLHIETLDTRTTEYVDFIFNYEDDEYTMVKK